MRRRVLFCETPCVCSAPVASALVGWPSGSHGSACRGETSTNIRSTLHDLAFLRHILAPGTECVPAQDRFREVCSAGAVSCEIQRTAMVTSLLGRSR